jgi:hypothetical protein
MPGRTDGVNDNVGRPDERAYGVQLLSAEVITERLNHLYAEEDSSLDELLQHLQALSIRSHPSQKAART